MARRTRSSCCSCCARSLRPGREQNEVKRRSSTKKRPAGHQGLEASPQGRWSQDLRGHLGGARSAEAGARASQWSEIATKVVQRAAAQRTANLRFKSFVGCNVLRCHLFLGPARSRHGLGSALLQAALLRTEPGQPTEERCFPAETFDLAWVSLWTSEGRQEGCHAVPCCSLFCTNKIRRHVQVREKGWHSEIRSLAALS